MPKKSTSPKLHALGRKVTSFRRLETFPRPPGIRHVTCITDEVTANCPITNQPDWYEVHVHYHADKLCVESKTVKLYFHSYRDKGLFCEAFADKIAQDFAKALKPFHILVEVTQKPRGGVSIVAVAELKRLNNGQFIAPRQTGANPFNLKR